MQLKWIKFEDRKRIEAALNSHRTLCQVAEALDLRRSTLINEVLRSGGRDNYTAVEAQRLADERKKQMREKMSGIARKSSSALRGFECVPRILALEMQVQILSETIKELLNVSRNK